MTRQTAYMTEVRDITGYSHYLAMKSQMSGMLVFDGHKATSEETSLRRVPPNERQNQSGAVGLQGGRNRHAARMFRDDVPVGI